MSFLSVLIINIVQFIAIYPWNRIREKIYPKRKKEYTISENRKFVPTPTFRTNSHISPIICVFVLGKPNSSLSAVLQITIMNCGDRLHLISFLAFCASILWCNGPFESLSLIPLIEKKNLRDVNFYTMVLITCQSRLQRKQYLAVKTTTSLATFIWESVPYSCIIYITLIITIINMRAMNFISKFYDLYFLKNRQYHVWFLVWFLVWFGLVWFFVIYGLQTLVGCLKPDYIYIYIYIYIYVCVCVCVCVCDL